MRLDIVGNARKRKQKYHLFALSTEMAKNEFLELHRTNTHRPSFPARLRLLMKQLIICSKKTNAALSFT